MTSEKSSSEQREKERALAEVNRHFERRDQKRLRWGRRTSILLAFLGFTGCTPAPTLDAGVDAAVVDAGTDAATCPTTLLPLDCRPLAPPDCRECERTTVHCQPSACIEYRYGVWCCAHASGWMS